MRPVCQAVKSARALSDVSAHPRNFIVKALNLIGLELELFVVLILKPQDLPAKGALAFFPRVEEQSNLKACICVES